MLATTSNQRYTAWLIVDFWPPYVLAFLSLALGASPTRKKSWKPVIDKIKLRLIGWKRRFLSFAGRLTLIKFVMSNLPVYYLSLFRVPEGVAKEIGRLQESFLWGGTE